MFDFYIGAIGTMGCGGLLVLLLLGTIMEEALGLLIVLPMFLILSFALAMLFSRISKKISENTDEQEKNNDKKLM